MTVVKTSRIVVTTWFAAVAGLRVLPASTPLWIRIGLAALVVSPIVVALAIWPVLILRGMPDAPVPDTSTDLQETRIQVLDGGESR